MPGFELIGDEELAQVTHLFKESGILFRHSFDPLRNGIYKVREFEEAFAKRMKVSNALAVTSGSTALKVALQGLGIGPGDEVITQAFTFVATPESIIEVGAQPIITQINDTLNMDPSDFESKITDKTKAVIVVHMLGVPADMNPILAIAKKHNITVIEDTAWGCGGSLNGIPLGTLGDMGTYSFDFAKTMTTGEGGMVVTNNKQVYDKCAAVHDHGHENNPDFPRWEDTRSGTGFNYRMTEMQGAVGLAQLEKLDYIVSSQRANKEKILAVLKTFSEIELRRHPEGTFDTADALIFKVENNELAVKCRNQLLKDGLGTKILPEAISWHFAGTWDHMPSLVSKYGNLDEAFSDSKKILNACVALPISVNMPDDIDSKILNSLKTILK
jgi:8-amino-3,8-dideoxy-alpha-D-manno-octulosonate transaminase